MIKSDHLMLLVFRQEGLWEEELGSGMLFLLGATTSFSADSIIAHRLLFDSKHDCKARR
jgi:hypothetical protein